MVRQVDADTPGVKILGGPAGRSSTRTARWSGWSPRNGNGLATPGGTAATAPTTTGDDFAARWRTEGHPTPKAAFDALVYLVGER
jgi:hypothetical protein